MFLYENIPCFSFLFLGFHQLATWAPAVVNHLYWSINTCNGNGDDLVERFLSVTQHVCNKHTFPGLYYTRCAHDRYTEEESLSRDWIKPGSPTHEALLKFLKQRQLVKDLAMLNENVSTSELEVFHSLKIRYLPKSIFYEKEKMIAGTELAVMDHNYNVDRPQVITILFKTHKYIVKDLITRYTQERATFLKTSLIKLHALRE